MLVDVREGDIRRAYETVSGHEPSLRVIDYLDHEDGPVSTSELTAELGISREQLKYARREKLVPEGIVEVTDAPVGYGDRTPPKQFSLTEVGERVIDRGVLDSADFEFDPDTVTLTREEVEELKQTIAEQERKIESIKSGEASVALRLSPDEMTRDELEDLLMSTMVTATVNRLVLEGSPWDVDWEWCNEQAEERLREKFEVDIE